MAATARLVVQMTPEEKIALDIRARGEGISTAEFVRRRIGPDEFDGNREEIETLLATLEAAAPHILRSLDAAISATTSTVNAVDAVTGGIKP